MTPQELKNSILQFALQGKLTKQEDSETVDLSFFSPQKDSRMEHCELELPHNWHVGTLESFCEIIPTKPYQILEKQVKPTGKYPVISQSQAYQIGFSDERERLYQIDIPVIAFGDHTTVVKYLDFDFIVGADGVKLLKPKGAVSSKYLFYALQLFTFGLEKVGGYSRHYKFIKNRPIPIPPLAEQARIVAKIEKLLPLIDRYEQAWNRLEDFNRRFPLDMQKSLLQWAIQGKLVEQRPEEGTAEELLTQVLLHDRIDGQRVKQKTISEITEEEKAFEIPENWIWVKLGEVCMIARGGSPRPIKEYLTTAEDGVNWIKISDTEKNGKYICAAAEKIKPSGVSKSRMVHCGDLLLTNSMSFGRPYLLKIDGCIHDGWLVISQINKIFHKDYLYWMLSSNYAYWQFCGKVSGAVVKNLNSEKVANSVFPLPPLAEQQRIVAKLEELLPLCERLR